LLGVTGAADTAHLRSDKIVVWPAEGDRYGIDLFLRPPRRTVARAHPHAICCR